MLLSALIVLVAPRSPAHATLAPATGTFTVSPGGSVTETKTVGVPASPPKADIEIAIDTTGSMGPAIAAAKSEATNLVNAIKADIPDAQFAVVDFKDSTDGPAAEHQVRTPMTGSAPTVQAAINAMSATGGGDFPEAYNLVFDKAATPLTGGDLGWRTGSRKFVVVIGDAPSARRGTSRLPELRRQLGRSARVQHRDEAGRPRHRPADAVHGGDQPRHQVVLRPAGG